VPDVPAPDVPAPDVPAPPVPGVPLAVALPSPLTELADDRLARAGIRLYLKRDDLINPDFPGNKWRKLSLNLAAARHAGCTALGTFGGAYSNHIRAVAAAGQRFGFATIGVIRGEEHQPLNPSLRAAAARGMRLTYMDRATYVLPEGGSNGLAARGCTRIPAEIGVPFDVICCPCGTGGTLAGVAAGLHGGQRALGFSALRGGGRFLPAAVTALQDEAFGGRAGQWEIDDRFHFGGFARRNAELDGFIADFADRHGLTLDWVYVAKMMYGIYARAGEGALAPGTTAVAVITG
jgi:1-aminocyclopropane-1-carboxylate deaminase